MGELSLAQERSQQEVPDWRILGYHCYKMPKLFLSAFAWFFDGSLAVTALDICFTAPFCS